MIAQLKQAVGVLVLSGRDVSPVEETINSHHNRLDKILTDLWKKYPLVDGNELPPEGELLEISLLDAQQFLEELGEAVEQTSLSLETDAEFPFLGEVDYSHLESHLESLSERARHLVALPLGHAYSVATAALNVDLTV